MYSVGFVSLLQWCFPFTIQRILLISRGVRFYFKFDIIFGYTSNICPTGVETKRSPDAVCLPPCFGCFTELVEWGHYRHIVNKWRMLIFELALPSFRLWLDFLPDQKSCLWENTHLATSPTPKHLSLQLVSLWFVAIGIKVVIGDYRKVEQRSLSWFFAPSLESLIFIMRKLSNHKLSALNLRIQV